MKVSKFVSTTFIQKGGKTRLRKKVISKEEAKMIAKQRSGCLHKTMLLKCRAAKSTVFTKLTRG